MDLKGAFNHVGRNYLLSTMEGIEADEGFMRWMESFMSDINVGLVIDGHQCKETAVETDVPQGSPISPILFAMYLSMVFKEVEKEVDGCVATSFTDDCWWLMEAD